MPENKDLQLLQKALDRLKEGFDSFPDSLNEENSGKIEADDRFISIMKPEIDIVIWAPKGSSLSKISERSSEIFQQAAKKNIHLALINYPAKLLNGNWDQVVKDQDHVTCLRSCLMKPEHEGIIDEIWKALV
jgi:hypothetical protein